MLKTLSVRNYALIKSLEIDFENGFTAITGETGAGKSIILGAMQLILGQRADSSVTKNQVDKCVVEGTFEIAEYNLSALFEKNDLDYFNETILRREILPSGKSRAFVNDTPVNLQVLKSVASKLIDIHSQSQNLEIEDKSFQLNVIDSHAGTEKESTAYRIKFNELQKTQRKLADLKEASIKAKADHEYLQFQFDKLDQANLRNQEEHELEHEQNLLSHAEEIKTALEETSHILHHDETGIIGNLAGAIKATSGIADYMEKASELAQRLESVKIELLDLASDTDTLNESIEFDTARLDFVNERLSLLFELKQKHHVESVAELIEIKESLEQKLLKTENIDHEITGLEKTAATLQADVTKLAQKLSKKRQQSFVSIQKYVKERLVYLGMPNGTLLVNCAQTNASKTGTDDISFLFSANKNHAPQVLSQVASGGEKSRLMLVIKALLAQKQSLPTIIFDEIDTGISGDIAQKLAGQLQQLAQNMQLMAITHLPQVASRANAHLKVYKKDNTEGTTTSIRILNNNERILELAEMLSGKNPSEAAILNAQELLNN